MTELLDFTKPHVLRNEAEYTAAVAEIDQLLDLDPPPQSEAYERLEFLSVLVHAYEEAHFPLEQLTTPQDVVTFMLEQKGLLHTDLAEWLGGESPMRAFLQGNCESTWASQRISSSVLAQPLPRNCPRNRQSTGESEAVPFRWTAASAA
jgi:HTH-type transcriptional regulator / antitoxin HigA